MGTADQYERGTATQQPIIWICCPGVVELVRSNLGNSFPLFHEKLPVSVSVCRILGDKTVTVLRVPVSSLLVTITISEGVVSIRGSVSVHITANQETKP